MSHWTRGKAMILSKLNILEGSHWDSLDNARLDKYNKRVCIMEAINFIQHGMISDDPPCVSETIRSLMIDRNDAIDDVARQRLKKLVPEIIHTAPTRQRPSGKVMRDSSNAQYKKVEQERCRLLRNWSEPGEPELSEFSVRAFNKLIRQLVNVEGGKFDA